MSYLRYPAYKDSGVEWLGEIPTHWNVSRLRFSLTTNPSKNEVMLQGDELVSFVPMEAVGEYGGLILALEKPLDDISGGYTYFANNDVIVAKITPCFENGKGALALGLTNQIAFGTTELHVLRAGPALNNRFLFHITLSQSFRQLGEAEMYGAGGQKRVPETFIKDFRIGLPSFSEQHAIATFLDHETTRIDGLIAKQEQMIALLQEKRKALISNAVTRGLDPDVPLKDSGMEWLGRVPEHWRVKRFAHAIQRIETGWTPNSEQRLASENEWGVLKVGCIREGRFFEEEHKALAEDAIPLPELEVRVGDWLMSRANTKELVASVGLIEYSRRYLTLSDKTFRIMLYPEHDKKFFNYLLQSSTARYQIEIYATGASQSMQNISQESVRNIRLAMPPIDEQAQIVIFLDQQMELLNTLVVKAQSAIDLLKEHRASLIAAAVTGKIDVRGFAPGGAYGEA